MTDSATATDTATATDSASATDTATDTATATDSTSATDTATATAATPPGDLPSATTSEATGQPTGGISPTAPVITGTPATVRTLTLADIFQHDGWSEGSVRIPRSAQPVQGIADEVSCTADPLELRFAQQTGRLSLTVAQSLDSASSAATLSVKLLANGRLADSKAVKFNDVRTLGTALTGVSAVSVQIKSSVAAKQPCTTTAVISDIKVTPGA